MGVYSSGRLAFTEGYASEVEIPEPNTSYYGHDGANRILAEAAVNDLAMFEAIIGNDIQQAYVENAINEGAELGTELEALQEAAAGGIFSRLKDFLKKIWEKITGLIMSFIRKVQGAVTTDNKKLVDKFKKAITTNGTKLKKMKFKWSKPLHPDFTYGAGKGVTPADIKSTAAAKVETVFGAAADLSKDEVSQGKAKIVKGYNDLNADLDKDDWEDEQLTHYIGSTTVAEFATDAHKFFFDDEDTVDGEFSSIQLDVMGTLTGSKDKLKGLEDNKKKIDDYFKKAIREVEQFTDRAAKAVGDDKSTKTWTQKKGNVPMTATGTVQDNGVEITNAVAMTRAGAAVQRFYSMYQSVITKVLNAQMAAVSFHIKQCRRVWTQAAAFVERPVKEDALLFDAIGEAADFETDQLIGY